jgi:hypothetical protein
LKIKLSWVLRILSREKIEKTVTLNPILKPQNNSEYTTMAKRKAFLPLFIFGF